MASMYSRYQGDPLMSLGPDGWDLVFSGGNPTMHKGLTNAVLLSLFLETGWQGAKLIGCETLSGSNFLNACNAPLTISNMNRIRQSAEKALSWIKGSVEVQVANPTGSQLAITIIIRPPQTTREKVVAFLLSKEGLNWRYQLLGE